MKLFMLFIVNPLVPWCRGELGVLPVLNLWVVLYVTVQHPHLTSPIEGEETFFPRPWWEGLGEGGELIPEGIEQSFNLNQDIYTKDAFYTGTTVKIGHTGYMRDLPVAHVQFYPVQYNPVTGELRLYRHILARITWDTPKPAAAKSIGRSAAYDNMLKDQ